MFGKPIHLFRISGFDIRLDASWFVLFFLITFTLALGLFPYQYPGLSFPAYLSMGVIGALGLFASIVFHEVSHSVVARRFGLRMKGITLFMFGGMAEMPEDPRKPAAEFWMAIAGPISSLVLAAAFYGVFSMGAFLAWPGSWNGILGYLALVNVFLAAFNMVPAFPLDGGRVLRSAVWQFTGDYARATRIASAIGSGFGLFFFILGAARIIAGNVVGGVWMMLIGLFIRAGARSTITLMNYARILKDETVRSFMNRHPVTVAPGLPIRDLVDNYLYRHNYKLFPVRDGERVIGCIGLAQVKAMTPQQWDTLKVADAMAACPGEAMIPAETPVEQALKRMQESGQSTLMVVENGEVAGIVTTADILHYLTMKLELEEAEDRAGPETPVTRPSAGEPLPA